MKRKIAILRGINVGGKRKILMADLKSMFETLHFSGIQTYIQSGNVLFHTDNDDHAALSNSIEKAIDEQFGFEVPVIIRTAEELAAAVDKNPFYQDAVDVKQLHLTFLEQEPSPANKQHTESYNYEPDEFVIEGKHVFIYCDGKYHKSKLSNTFFEKQLQVKATTRNWKTVLKLWEMSR